MTMRILDAEAGDHTLVLAMLNHDHCFGRQFLRRFVRRNQFATRPCRMVWATISRRQWTYRCRHQWTSALWVARLDGADRWSCGEHASGRFLRS